MGALGILRRDARATNSIGPPISFSSAPGTRELFIAPRVGFTVGHRMSAGALLGADPSAILPGWSLGAGHNVTLAKGVQEAGNGSGTLAEMVLASQGRQWH